MIRQISDKQLVKLQQDVEVKHLLIKRCGGQEGKFTKYRGVLINITCVGGKSEFSGKPPTWLPLSNHEIQPKSDGGEVSLTNSIMLTAEEHDLAQRHLISRGELYKKLEEISGHRAGNSLVGI